MSDQVGAYLAEVRQRGSSGKYYNPALLRNEDVPRLLAAVEAVLEQHRPGRIGILGALCPRHENHRHFSITSMEATDVVACQDCSATVYDSCTGCGPQMRLDSCPARTAISRALLGEEG
jgi:hypothetical protein